MDSFDIFMSFAWDKLKKEVNELKDELEEKYTIKIDEKEKIYKGIGQITNEDIDHSKVFLCCLTEEYVKDDNRMIELNLAIGLQKPILWVIFDQNENIDYEEMIKTQSRIKIYPEAHPMYNSSERDLIKKALDQILESPVSNQNCLYINTT